VKQTETGVGFTNDGHVSKRILSFDLHTQWGTTIITGCPLCISNSQNVKYLQKKSRENAERTERMQRREQEEKVSSID
jgi:hypothetical protein